MIVTYHIKINDDYAASVLEELHKRGAIEVVRETESEVLQDWQMTEVRQRIINNSPETLIDEEEVFRMLDAN